MGDGRRYDYVIAIRAVETIDFMTARWAHLPYDFLDLISRRIIHEGRLFPALFMTYPANLLQLLNGNKSKRR